MSIFGTVGPNNGPYGIQLDGGIVNVYNATKQALTSQILLYQADSLESGIHTVKLINQPAISGQTLDIDFAVVSLARYVTEIPYLLDELKAKSTAMMHLTQKFPSRE